MENPSTFTFCPDPPVYIGVSGGEGWSKNLHPTFTLSLYFLALRRYSWPLFVCLALQPRYLRAFPSLNLRLESGLS